MGAESWSHWQPWKKDLKTTLREAQKVALRELGYESVKEAHEAMEPDGTATVVDIDGFVDAPHPANSPVGPRSQRLTPLRRTSRPAPVTSSLNCWALTAAECEEHLGSAQPSREEIEVKVDALAEDLGRGESRCVVGYVKGQPAAVYFTGWSFD